MKTGSDAHSKGSKSRHHHQQQREHGAKIKWNVKHLIYMGAWTQFVVCKAYAHRMAYNNNNNNNNNSDMAMWIRAKSQTIYNIQNIYWFMFLHGFCCCCYGGDGNGGRDRWCRFVDGVESYRFWASDDCCRFGDNDSSSTNFDGQK